MAEAPRTGRLPWAALALAAFCALAALARLELRPGAANMRADRLYALALPDADGHSQALAQWKGRILVVNFWATWCAPCVSEMPELDRLQREFADRNVTVLGIGVEDPPRVRDFRDRLKLQLPLLAGGVDSLALARAFGDPDGVLPYTALFSADGQLLHSQVGAMPDGLLRRWLADSS